MRTGNSSITKAMVFAAGLGTRMQPLTLALPKPLIKIARKPLIDYTLDSLASAGVKEAVVNTHYKPEQITEYLAPRQNPKITISHEPILLETGGGVVNVLGQFSAAPFFCCNTDVILLDRNGAHLEKLMKAWDKEKMDMLLLLCPIEKAFGYSGNGDFFIGPDGRLPPLEKNRASPFIFTGVQIISPQLFAGKIPSGPFSLNYFYKNNMQPDGYLARIYGVVHDGDWLHIGTPEVIPGAEKIIRNQP